MPSATALTGNGTHSLCAATRYGEAYGGLRSVFRALGIGCSTSALGGYGAEAEVLLGERAAGQPASDPPLREIALSPSERRLHRESEQVFRVLNAAACALAGSLGGGTVLLAGVEHTDFLTLRALRRLCEAADYRGTSLRLTLQGTPGTMFPGRREGLLRALDGRVTLLGDGPPAPPAREGAAGPPDRESELLARALGGDGTAADRLGSCIGALQHCFFSTNLEASWRVLDTAEHLLDDLGPDPGDLAGHLSACLSSEHNFAVEFEASALSGVADVRAFLRKHRGVVRSFAGEFEASARHFADMVGPEPVMPELVAQSYLYRALTLAKRLDRVAEGRALVTEGLAYLSRQGTTPELRREEGWLRNVLGLTYFFEGDLRSAVAEERRALECVAGMADPSSTHLKINVVSNLSVLQESAGRHEDALATWTKFLDRGGEWDASFLKHHRYRAAGLRVKAGDRRGAVTELRDACDAAAALHDTYHENAVSQELGALLLDLDEPAEAAACFERARVTGDRLAEPLAWSLATVGLALASDEVIPGEAAAVAERSLTYRDRAAALARDVRQQDRAALARQLPRPRTKLNRPFDLVNI